MGLSKVFNVDETGITMIQYQCPKDLCLNGKMQIEKKYIYTVDSRLSGSRLSGLFLNLRAMC